MDQIQTTVYKAHSINLNTEIHEPYQKPWSVIVGAREVQTHPDLRVVSVPLCIHV